MLQSYNTSICCIDHCTPCTHTSLIGQQRVNILVTVIGIGHSAAHVIFGPCVRYAVPKYVHLYVLHVGALAAEVIQSVAFTSAHHLYLW